MGRFCTLYVAFLIIAIFMNVMKERRVAWQVDAPLFFSWWTIYESTSPIPAAIVAWRLLRSTLQRLASPLCNCVRTHTHTKLQLLLLLCFYPACSCFPVFWLLLPESKDSKDQKAKGKCSVFPLFPESTPSPNGLLCLVASSEAIRTLPKQF